MLNKELLIMGGADSEATVVLKIQHREGGFGDTEVTMHVQYIEDPYTSITLSPPIPLKETMEYVIKIPKGTKIDIWGGSNDLEAVQVTPSTAAVKLDGYYKSAYTVLDSCTIQGIVYT